MLSAHHTNGNRLNCRRLWRRKQVNHVSRGGKQIKRSCLSSWRRAWHHERSLNEKQNFEMDLVFDGQGKRNSARTTSPLLQRPLAFKGLVVSFCSQSVALHPDRIELSRLKEKRKDGWIGSVESFQHITHLLSIKFDSKCGYKTHRDEECWKVRSGDEAEVTQICWWKSSKLKKKK